MNSKSININVDVSGFKETLVNYIVPIVSLIISIIIVAFVIYPSYKSLPNLKADFEAKTLLEKNLTDKLVSLNRLVDFKSVVDENSALVNKVLVSEELVPSLLTQVDRMVRDSGLNISRLNYSYGASPEQDGNSDTFSLVMVNLAVSGSFAQMKEFMTKTEQAARLIDIDSFRYSLAKDDNGDYLSISMTLKSPYMFVESNAVTDEAVNIDISDPEFIKLVNKLKGLTYYDPAYVNTNVPVVEAEEPDETETNEETATPTPETVTP